MIARGSIWWADLALPAGSGPGFRRPVLIVSADTSNASRINTVIAVAITSNLSLRDAPGNVFLPDERSGLPRDSVVDVSQILTLDKRLLDTAVGTLDADTLRQVEHGLRLALELDAA